MRAPSLPKIARAIVERPRLATWLRVCSTVPLRLICAPAGSGKTTSVVVYARSCPNACVYVEVPAGAGADELLALLVDAIDAIDATTTAYPEFIAQLARLSRLEIILDNVDRAGPQTLELLRRLISDTPDHVTFIYVARSAQTIDFGAAHARGLVELCAPALFALDATDVAALAGGLQLAPEPAAVDRLCEATHGWAMAVAGACRTAAAYDLPLDEALILWRRTSDAALRDLVGAVVRSLPEQPRAAVVAAVCAGSFADEQTLRLLRRWELFVSAWDGSLAVNPLLRTALAETCAAYGTDRMPPATIEMFGRFSMAIGGRVVTWQRRRDRQLIAFLAMQPDGRATRAELIRVFWPDHDPQLAGQSLRTACSTIRRAIAACVGSANVGRYFVADWIVELKLGRAVISARRFADLAEHGRAAEAQHDLPSAFAHYRAAQALYRGPFLGGEPPLDWSAPFERDLAATFDRLSARVVRLGFECRSIDPAARELAPAPDELSA